MEEMVRLLIEHGANIDARGDSDWGTALQVAAFYGQEGTARILLENGADVHVQAGRFGTAWEAAWNRGHKKLATLLFKFGARATI
jgi:ankyrin repeat protein